MKKEILIIGAGNIGRGVIGGLFSESGYHLYLYDVMAERMRQLKEQGTYLVERAGVESKYRVLVDDFDVLDCSDDRELVECMEKVSLVACCVYEGAFSSICQSLAKAISYRAEHGAGEFNVLLCVNALGAPDYFETALATALQENQKAVEYLERKVGICQVLVGMGAMPSTEELLKEDAFAVTTRLEGHIGIDEEPFKGTLPEVRSTSGVKKGKAQIYRKVYAGNMKHCMTAFLGKAKGYTYIRDTYEDEWVEECTLGAFYEAERAVAAEYGFEEKERQEWIDSLVSAPKNKNLQDSFTRVAADPKTKLSRDNRFVGPALLCIRHGILPYYLAKGIAYGFLYRDEADAASVELTDFVKENGIEKAVETYCGLAGEDWILKQLILAQYKEVLKLR